MGHPRPLFVYLRSFQTNKTIFTTYKYEKCPSSMRCWNSNPQPSPPITSRSRFLSPSPTLMAFTGVTNAHGPSPQPTECRSPTFSLDHGCRLISSRHCTHSLARSRAYKLRLRRRRRTYYVRPKKYTEERNCVSQTVKRMQERERERKRKIVRMWERERMKER